MPWDDAAAADDEPTNVIALTPEHDDHSSDNLHDTTTREIAVMASQPAREEPRPRPAAREAEPAPVTREAPPAAQKELPVTAAVRVRLIADERGVRVVPENESTTGMIAVLVPVNAGDDLRAIFQRRT
jgi:hypothetical protein